MFAGDLPIMVAFDLSRISKRMSIAALKYPPVAVAAALAVLSVYGQFKTPDNPIPSSDIDLAYGAQVSFGAGGNAEPFQVSGWSETETQFTWTEGTSAVLAIRVSPTTNRVVLRMHLAGLTKDPELPFQPVEVYVNDRKIADWQVAKPAGFNAAIPQEMTQSGGLLRITLKIPKAVSPKTLKMSVDSRVLGVQCSDLQLVIQGYAAGIDLS
jgi:hypothetical protein